MGYESADISELQRTEARDFVEWLGEGTREERLFKKSLFYPDEKNPLYFTPSGSQAAEQLSESTAAAKEYRKYEDEQTRLELGKWARERDKGNVTTLNAQKITGGPVVTSNSSTFMSRSINDQNSGFNAAVNV